MTLEEMKAGLESLSDGDLLSLLDSVSDEVKRRNSILGPPEARKEVIQKGLEDLLGAIGGPRPTR